ncbi:MAG: hypothetical protein JSS60_04120 [Verrucomicrobia bacterium]|nr:hypothetical protein [Verrucomicrobiota bacterium]
MVSTFSGGLRINYGKVEVIGGVIAAALTAIVALAQSNADDRERGLNKAVEILATYSLHGIANIFRGAIEMIPLLSLATCLPYDLLGNRLAYPKEGRELHGYSQVTLQRNT